MRLGRRGFTPAIEHPVDGSLRRGLRRGGRVQSAASIVTCLLVTISLAEVAWIAFR